MFAYLQRIGRALMLPIAVLPAAAIALLLAPAAYHRKCEPDRISRTFVDTATLLISWGMIPLMLAISLDFYLIAHVILASIAMSIAVASLVCLFFFYLWIVFPRIHRRRAS